MTRGTLKTGSDPAGKDGLVVVGYSRQAVLASRGEYCIFLDGERLANGAALAAPLRPQSEIYVMQALSGG